jgi:hypothetical protein
MTSSCAAQMARSAASSPVGRSEDGPPGSQDELDAEPLVEDHHQKAMRTMAASWRDILQTFAYFRAAASTIDRLLQHSGSSSTHPQLAMALIETSQAAHQALVMLAEARELLSDLSARHRHQGPLNSDFAGSGALDERLTEK